MQLRLGFEDRNLRRLPELATYWLELTSIKSSSLHASRADVAVSVQDTPQIEVLLSYAREKKTIFDCPISCLRNTSIHQSKPARGQEIHFIGNLLYAPKRLPTRPKIMRQLEFQFGALALCYNYTELHPKGSRFSLGSHKRCMRVGLHLLPATSTHHQPGYAP
jgi:hypothetical protein